MGRLRAKCGQALVSRLGIHWRAFFEACRALANAPNAARHWFQGLEFIGGRFSRLVTRLQTRQMRPGTGFKAWNSLAGVFRGLSRACKRAKRGQALVSRLGIHWRAFFEACRALANAPNAARHWFQGLEFIGGRFSRLVTRLQTRQTRPGTGFKAWNSLAGVFRGLSRACKRAKRGQALVSRLGIHWRAFFEACHALANAPNAARHWFQGLEFIGGRFSRLVTRLQTRQTRPGTGFKAWNSLAGVFRGLSRACKRAKRGQALVSRLGIHWRAFFEACHALANAPNAARHWFQGLEFIGGRFSRLVTRLQTRQTRPGTGFKAWNSLAGVFRGLSRACKRAKRGQALVSRLGIHWRAFFEACHALANAPNAARHWFQGLEFIGGRFSRLVTRLQTRQTRPGTGFKAWNSLAGVFRGLSRACKRAKRGQALVSRLGIHWRAFFEACHALANAPNAARHWFQGLEFIGGRFSRLVARLQTRQMRPGTGFKAWNSLAGVFRGLSRACKRAKRGQALVSRLGIHWRAFFEACRALANAPNAARHWFQGLEFIGGRFSRLVTRLQTRQMRPGTGFKAWNSLAGVFRGLSRACKRAKRGQALVSRLGIHWRAFFEACHALANAPNAARHWFQGLEFIGGRFSRLVTRLQTRQTRPGTGFKAWNSLAGVFRGLSRACKRAKCGQALVSRLGIHWRAFFEACHALANAPNAARHWFQGLEFIGGRFSRLVTRLQTRQTRPGTGFKAWNSLAGVFRGLSRACKRAKCGQALVSRLGIHWRAFFEACRALANAPNAARHWFQGLEFIGGRFSRLVTRLQTRQMRPGTGFKAWNSLAGVFRGLSRACKRAKCGQALVSRLGIHWRAFFEACHALANAPNAARHWFQGLEFIGGRLE